MNWARGLFRIWLVGGIAWTAVVVTIFVFDQHMFDANKTYDVEGPSKEKYELSARPNTNHSDIVEFVKQHPRKDCEGEKKGPWCDYPIRLEMPAQYNVGPMIYAALGPPLAFLIFGSGLYWAVTGFRRR
jgi:hypothetical protein